MRVLSHCTAQRGATSGALLPLGQYGALREHTQCALIREFQTPMPGEIKIADTTRDPHKYRKFSNTAAQNLEEKKQILYLLGPIGGGMSSPAENLQKERFRIKLQHLQSYKLKRGGEL